MDSLKTSLTAVPELLLSTPQTLVLRARAEFDDGSQAQEAGLVIPRRGCCGECPSLEALQAAARLCAQRLSRGGSAVRRLRRLLIRVDGGWVPVLGGHGRIDSGLPSAAQRG